MQSVVANLEIMESPAIIKGDFGLDNLVSPLLDVVGVDDMIDEKDALDVLDLLKVHDAAATPAHILHQLGEVSTVGIAGEENAEVDVGVGGNLDLDAVVCRLENGIGIFFNQMVAKLGSVPRLGVVCDVQSQFLGAGGLCGCNYEALDGGQGDHTRDSPTMAHGRFAASLKEVVGIHELVVLGVRAVPSLNHTDGAIAVFLVVACGEQVGALGPGTGFASGVQDLCGGFEGIGSIPGLVM